VRALFYLGCFLVYVSVLLGAWKEIPLFVIGAETTGQIVAVEQPTTSGFRESDLRVRYKFVDTRGLGYAGEAVLAPNSDLGRAIKQTGAGAGHQIGIRYLAACPSVSRLTSDASPTGSIGLLMGLFLMGAAVVSNVRLRRGLQRFDLEVGTRFARKTPDARYVGAVEGALTYFDLHGLQVMIRGPREAALLSLDGLAPDPKRDSRYSAMLTVAALLVGLPLFLDLVFLLCDSGILAESWSVGLNLLVPLGVFVALRHRRPTEWAVFTLPSGEEVFAVPRDGPDSPQWQEFVDTVKRRIMTADAAPQR
jgi:hypothetical protein